MSTLAGWLLGAQVAATCALCGILWIVQVALYPLFDGVGREAFPRYVQRYVRRVTWVVAPAMLVELVAATWLFLDPPEGVALWMPAAGLALVVFAWLVTALVSVPCHDRLRQGFEARTHRRLVSTNWLRTAAWSVRVPLAVLMLERALSTHSTPS